MPERYQTIVADPPWSYGRDDSRFPTYPGTPGTDRQREEANMGYCTMTTDAIRRLPVADFMAVDARLFLWATSRHLAEAFQCLEGWGLRYRQTIVWHKTGDATPFGGSVAPNHAEFLLVAIQGAPSVLSRGKSSVLAMPRSRRHSQKPDAFLDFVEQVSPGPYLEMFARRDRLGWDTWGNESLGTAEMAA